MMESRPPTPRKARLARSARNDCRTCVARRWKCDRARPHCKNCESAGNVCPGFAVQLSWQPGFSLQKKPVKKTIASRSRWRGYEDGTGPRQLEFISEHLTGPSREVDPPHASKSSRIPPYAADRAQLRWPSESRHGCRNSRVTSSVRFDDGSNRVKNRAGARAEEIFTHNGVFSAAESLHIDGLGAEEVSVHTEDTRLAEPFDADDSFDTINVSPSRSRSTETSELHFAANRFDDQIQGRTPSDKMLVWEVLDQDFADDPDHLDAISSPSTSSEPSPTSHKDLRALSYHLLHAIPPRPLYAGQFEWLEAIFARCNVDPFH